MVKTARAIVDPERIGKGGQALTRWRRCAGLTAIAALAAGLCAWGAEAQAIDANAAGRRPSVVTAQLSPPTDVPGQGDANADPADAASLLLRVDRLEEQLRLANGEIEEWSPCKAAQVE